MNISPHTIASTVGPAASAALPPAVLQAAGAPIPDGVSIIAAVTGALCSTYMRENNNPRLNAGYVVGSIIHAILAAGIGLSIAAILKADLLQNLPLWAMVFPLSTSSHLLMPAIGHLLSANSLGSLVSALSDRLRGGIKSE